MMDRVSRVFGLIPMWGIGPEGGERWLKLVLKGGRSGEKWGERVEQGKNATQMLHCVSGKEKRRQVGVAQRLNACLVCFYYGARPARSNKSPKKWDGHWATHHTRDVGLFIIHFQSLFFFELTTLFTLSCSRPRTRTGCVAPACLWLGGTYFPPLSIPVGIDGTEMSCIRKIAII